MNGKSSVGQEDWELVYQFMDNYISLLKNRHGKDDYLTTVLKEDLGGPEDFRKRWENFDEEQKNKLLERASLGAKAFLEQYDQSPEARRIREEIEKVAEGKPLDKGTMEKVAQLVNKFGNELSYLDEIEEA